jgi:hypothetical protein
MTHSILKQFDGRWSVVLCSSTSTYRTVVEDFDFDDAVQLTNTLNGGAIITSQMFDRDDDDDDYDYGEDD